jgi:hypothetical protein
MYLSAIASQSLLTFVASSLPRVAEFPVPSQKRMMRLGVRFDFGKSGVGLAGGVSRGAGIVQSVNVPEKRQIAEN